MKEGSIFHSEQEIAVTPAVRMTRGELFGKKTGTAKRKRIDSYLNCKQELQIIFRNHARALGISLPMSTPVSLRLEAHYTDNRKRDLKNIVGTVEDSLVTAGILVDDGSKYLPIYDRVEVKLQQERPFLRVTLTPVHIS